MEFSDARGNGVAVPRFWGSDPDAPREPPAPTKRTQKCMWCLNPFDRAPRTSGEFQIVREALLVTDGTYEPVICDTCFRTVLENRPPVGRVLDVPAFLLRATG
jgi:hypothetical protein